MQTRVTRLVLVPFDQLSRDRGVMRDADPVTDGILMVQSESMLTSRRWHAQRVHLVLSSAAHHAQALRARGFSVHEVTAPTLVQGIAAARAARPGVPVVATAPRSRPLHLALERAGVDLVADDSFLTPRADFASWSPQRLPVMEAFYRRQRTRLGILMEDGAPVGGQWNFDAANRLPPPKTEQPWPEPLHHPFDDLDQSVWDDIMKRGLPVVGDAPTGTWASTREGALRQLQHFLETGLPGFGPYEDAIPRDTWTVNHSLLSPYLNLGLLDPDEVVAAALARHAEGGVPVESIEAFVRQLVGWREFVNGA